MSLFLSDWCGPTKRLKQDDHRIGRVRNMSFTSCLASQQCYLASSSATQGITHFVVSTCCHNTDNTKKKKRRHFLFVISLMGRQTLLPCTALWWARWPMLLASCSTPSPISSEQRWWASYHVCLVGQWDSFGQQMWLNIFADNVGMIGTTDRDMAQYLLGLVKSFMLLFYLSIYLINTLGN